MHGRLTFPRTPGQPSPAEAVPMVLELHGGPKPDRLTHGSLTAWVASSGRLRKDPAPVVGAYLLSDVYLRGLIHGGSTPPQQIAARTMVPEWIPLGDRDRLDLHTTRPGRVLVWPLLLKK